MSSWKHPTLGPIEPLPREMQAAKVWKHFYDQSQHWERICERDVASMRREAEAVVGIQRDSRTTLPLMDRKRWDRTRDLLGRHHDAAYAPAYQAEMSSPDALWTPTQDAQRRHQVLTPNAVFAVVQVDGWNWVVTAFRPLPPTCGLDWDEVNIRRYAVKYFRRETGMHGDNLARTTTENLQRASTVVPRSAQDTWWLASAVGYGRLLAHHSEVANALAAAEAVLSEAPREVVAELARALDWDGCLRHLADALKDSRPEEAEAVLATAEELLVAASVVATETQTDAFCADAEALIAWLPAEWSHLLDRAASRREALGSPDHPVYRLWSAVEGAATGAAMRELPPVTRPVARLADAMIAARPPWRRWRARVAQLAMGTSAAVAEWVRSSLDGIHVARPAPVLGAAGKPPGSWEVLGRPAPEAPCFKMFVVDEANPEGREVTEHFDPAGDKLWLIEPGDEAALIVLVASLKPIRDGDLESVLTEAGRRDDVFVGTRELSPPR
jgi:hypothetical protein